MQVEFTPSFVDVDSAGPLTLSWSLADGQPLPSWLTVTNNSGKLTFSGTPPHDLAALWSRPAVPSGCRVDEGVGRNGGGGESGLDLCEATSNLLQPRTGDSRRQ